MDRVKYPHRKGEDSVRLTVKAIRINAGMTQEEFAKAIQMPYRTYQKKENGETEFLFSEMARIRELTGCDLNLIKID